MTHALLSTSVDWQDFYGQLQAFARHYGHVYVPDHDPAWSELYQWSLRQRRDKPYLSPAQVEALDGLGFAWLAPSAHQQRWEFRLQELRTFYGQHGHCRVPRREGSLYHWVEKQRRCEENLSAHQRQRLDALGFRWQRDMQAEKETGWWRWYNQLKAFHTPHGHCQLCQALASVELMSWVTRQRLRREALPQERRQALEALDFRWTPAQQWERMYEQARTFFLAHGHCYIPFRWPANQELASWMKRQRHRRHTLTAEQQWKLDQIHYPWQGRLRFQQQRWEAMYARLLAFHEQYGHADVPMRYASDPKLAKWARRQRDERGLLSQVQIGQLEALGFRWLEQQRQARQDKWERYYQALKTFHRQHGHFRVPTRTQAALSQWVAYHRSRREKLSAARQAKLEALGFPWQQQADNWQQFYTQLVAFKQAHSHLKVSRTKNEKLCSWMKRQWVMGRRLPTERWALLDAVGFWQLTHLQRRSLEERWETMHQQLASYQQVHGHCRVPAHWLENPAMAHWVRIQRRDAAQLTPQRRQALEALGFEWQLKRAQTRVVGVR